MKHALTSFALSLALVLPVLAACSGSTGDEPAPAADSTGSIDSEVKAGTKKSCAAVGGACVGLSPASCSNGHFADATKVSCGTGVGVACCVSCPVIPLPPGACDGGKGKVTPIKGADGCITGFECVSPPPPQCPVIPLPPGACDGGNGKVTPIKRADGCIIGFECVTPPTACQASGGTCVGLAPSSCPSGHWADAATHPCGTGTGIGVGCCLP